MDLLDVDSSRRNNEEGQTMAEYGVVLTIITAATVTVVSALAGGIEKAIDRATALLP